MSDVAVNGMNEAGELKGGGTTRVWPLVLLALILALAAVGLAFTAREQAEPVVLAILSFLAVTGLLALFGAAAGVFHIGRISQRDGLIGAAVQTAPQGMMIADENGRIIYANAAYGKLTGAGGPDEVRPVDRSFASHPEIADAVYRISVAARDGLAWQEDMRLLLPGDEKQVPQWLRVNVRPLALDKGRVWRVWTVNDVTLESERQEKTFQEVQDFIDYLDHAPAGFFSVTAKGRLKYVNATLAEWLGIDLAKTTREALSLEDIIAGDGIHLISGVKTERGGVAYDSFDIDLKCADKRVLPARVLHRVEFDETGLARPSRSLVLNRQDPSGMSGDDPLQMAELRFTHFFKNAPIGIAVIDAEGRIDTANGAFARIFKGQPLSHHPLIDLVASSSRAKLAELLTEARLDNNPLMPLDVDLGGVSGGTAKIILSRNDWEGAGRSGTLAYVIDTTEQRLLEEQFAQSQKMQAIGQLAGGIAHDFNNVLTSIIGFSDLLLGNHKPTDPSFRDIINIKHDAGRAAGLVRKLLAFSRRQTLRPQILSLTDVITDLTMMLGRLIGDKVELKLKHGSNLGLVKIDEHQFEQVIINLAVNARDAMMPEGGTLVISTENVTIGETESQQYAPMPAGDYVMCAVTDTGSGMPREVMEKIFEPFFTTKDVGEGTGLGLATVYGIVKQTGGYIFPESEMGEGTTFRIFLPRHVPSREEKEEARALEVAASKKPVRKDLTGEGKILLVEDEASVRAFAARALTSRGYEVIEAANGEVALQKVDEGHGDIDLVISDVMMPEMDGPTLLRELRQRMPDLKIIFISGYAEDAFEKNLEEGQDFTFLPKPFELVKLAETVKDVMEG